MKAVVQDRYGSPDVLEVREVEVPVIGPNEVLVRTRAAAVHIGDTFIMRGWPAVMRPIYGLRRPKDPVRGLDVAGVVEAAGEEVTRFRPGDEVFGTCTGACAEFVTTGEDKLVEKPADLPFAEAAAVPTSGLAALHGLRDAGKLRLGQSVLINGASGGVGTYAVQLAKVLGAEVTGVCSAKNVELVRSLGADHVIDYTQEDFTQGAARYDLILDNVANRSPAEYRRVLTPDGVYIPNGGGGGLGRVAVTFLQSLFLRQQGRPYLSTPNLEDLTRLRDLVATGEVRPVVGHTYPLEETADAMRLLETGHASGKVVITVA